MGSGLGIERGFLCTLEILDSKWARFHARMGLLLQLPSMPALYNECGFVALPIKRCSPFFLSTGERTIYQPQT